MVFSKPVESVVFSIAFVAAGALPAAAHADVTVTSVTHFGGIMGMGANNTTTKEYIKGDDKREERTLKFTGSILSKIGGTHNSVTIFRVDKNEIIKLDPANHTYTVVPMTVENVRELSNPQQQAGQGAQAQGAGSSKQNEDHTRVIRNDLSVKATGKHKSISGYPCEEYVMTWVVVTEDTQTKEQAKSVMTSNIWTTPETSALRTLKADEAAYNQAYLKRLGLDLSPQEQHRFGLNMLGLMSGRSQKDLKGAMSKIHGYPISTSVKWQSDANKDSSSGGSAANAEQTLNKVAGTFGSVLGNVFHHKKNGKKPAKAADNGMRTIFDSTTEIMKVKAGSVPASEFSVPVGYKNSAS